MPRFFRLLLWLLCASAAWAASAAPAAGRLVRHPAFGSRHVSAREVDVWLPPGYDEDSARRYPVVYMQDGQNLFDPKTSFGGVPWGVDRTMERLIAAGEIPPAIVVGVWNTDKRVMEYLPERAVAQASLGIVDRLKLWYFGPVLSDRYLRFLVEEVKPFVDRTYRTKPGAAHTFVLGSSMGGLISAYAIAEYPRVFGAAACLSTHWPPGDGVLVDYLGRHLPPAADHRLYFDYGTRTLDAEYEPYQQRMDAALRAAGYREGGNWVTRKFPGAEHSERAWSQRLGIPLKFLLQEEGSSPP